MPELSETAIVHMYRGELGRLTTYRVRLDTTTNWALGASVAVTTFTLGHGEAPAGLLLLPYLLSTVFAYIEARRFLDMEMSRDRVRCLEQRYFAPLARGEPPDHRFCNVLADALVSPSPPISLVEALGNRIRRNYFWVFLTLYAAWWVKLWLLGPSLAAAAAFGPVPGLVVLLVSPLLLVPWAVLGVATRGAGRSGSDVFIEDRPV